MLDGSNGGQITAFMSGISANVGCSATLPSRLVVAVLALRLFVAAALYGSATAVSATRPSSGNEPDEKEVRESGVLTSVLSSG
ncbi:hypothetical protein [Halomicrococcus sp. NG-SE-24]|uniref:hypothetical protein n=1 Tax=Halomicrococcus sp. NG-SE-24 TaxID=3436928 RepID=UPI003D997057